MHNKNILISPYSNCLTNGKESPKNWRKENWEELIKEIKANFDFNILQIGTSREEQIKGTDIFIRDQSFETIKKLLYNSRLFISVDNFLPHMAYYYNKKGLVIWGPSDSNIFGYKENINIYGDKQHLRLEQFWLWAQAEEINKKAFPTVDKVLEKLKKYLNL